MYHFALSWDGAECFPIWVFVHSLAQLRLHQWNATKMRTYAATFRPKSSAGDNITYLRPVRAVKSWIIWLKLVRREILSNTNRSWKEKFRLVYFGDDSVYFPPRIIFKNTPTHKQVSCSCTNNKAAHVGTQSGASIQACWTWCVKGVLLGGQWQRLFLYSLSERETSRMWRRWTLITLC